MDKFFSTYQVRKYAKGQVLILNGDTPGHVFHITEGRVKQYDITYRGDEIIVNVFKPPAYFPMSLAINAGDNHYVYEAETDIVVHQVPNDDIIGFIKDNPDVLYDLLSRVYRGIDGVLGRMTYLMAGSAKGRLIYELIIEARRASGERTSNDCKIDVNEKALGARAGLSRETVSREVSKLKHDGLIEIHPKYIRLKDVAALESKLGQEI